MIIVAKVSDVPSFLWDFLGLFGGLVFFLPLTKFLYTLHLECEDSLHLLNTPPDCNDQSDDLLHIVYDKLYNAIINITLFIIFHKIKIIKCLKIHNIKRPRLTHMIQIVLKGGP